MRGHGSSLTRTNTQPSLNSVPQATGTPFCGVRGSQWYGFNDYLVLSGSPWVLANNAMGSRDVQEAPGRVRKDGGEG